MLVYNELGMLNSSPPGAGGVARSAEGVETLINLVSMDVVKLNLGTKGELKIERVSSV